MAKKYKVRVKATMTKTTDYLEVGGYRDRFHYPDMTSGYEEFEVVNFTTFKGEPVEEWYIGAYPNDWVWHESWLEFVEAK